MSMNATEDLKKQLEEKEQLIKQLSQQIVVSSVLSQPTVAVMKKKTRRETWAAPKLSRKSFCKWQCLTNWLAIHSI
jgi:hypothetical protein